jgi:3-deoxy-D-manno-octulosonate 8-phosphate phosphatase (KDO 8-P phosphatase)
MQPSLRYAPALLLKAQAVAIAFFDVDGVLTDGGLYFSSEGETLKRFHALDGHGLKLLQMAGIAPAVITGRDSSALRMRLKELGIIHARYGVRDKRAAAQAILSALGLQWHQAAVMGDDWPDLSLMQQCAFSAAPPNAHMEVVTAADFVSERRGGDGAAREFCDLLLVASGKYAGLLEEARA